MRLDQARHIGNHVCKDIFQLFETDIETNVAASRSSLDFTGYGLQRLIQFSMLETN